MTVFFIYDLHGVGANIDSPKTTSNTPIRKKLVLLPAMKNEII